MEEDKKKLNASGSLARSRHGAILTALTAAVNGNCFAILSLRSSCISCKSCPSAQKGRPC